MASSSTPRMRAAATAPSTFSTLKRPRRRVVRSSSPIRKLEPVAVTSRSAVSPRLNSTGSSPTARSSSARARPYGSPTLIAGVEQLAERALEVDRLGRRTRRGAALPADPVLDRAKEAGTTAGGGEDGEEQERGRRLPVRPGDAYDLELLGRMVEERVGREGHGFACVSDDELRDGEVERAFNDEGSGAIGDRLRREVVAVGLEAANADEERPRGDPAGVVGKAGDLGAGGVDGALRAHGLAQAIQLDGAGF